MSDIVLMSDPRVAAVEVEGQDDPLVDLRAVDELLVDDRRSDSTGAFAHLRSQVADRALQAQEHLPSGLQLLIIEGYRPLELQTEYYEKYRDALLTDDGQLSRDEAERLASRYVAPPRIAPHVSGAAVDLTLADSAGKELDMGTAVNATPEESSGGCYTAARNISAAGLRNRHILVQAMEAAGLVNYPTEWWHWSYGDRYWAMQLGMSRALYGPVTAG